MNNNIRRNVTTAVLGAMALALAAGPAAAQSRTEVGNLECFIEAGTGFIIGSEKELSCVFKPAGGGTQETYGGKISRIGIDIGRTERTIVVWLVLAPTSGYAPRALAGTYVGASGEATVGVGLGANVLVGGSNDTIALQPLSVQAQTGLNIALGIATLTLN